MEKHPNCSTADIVAATGFSLSTVERSIVELKQQGLIEHTGSKKTGGYKAVNNPPEENDEPTANNQ
ncbi:MAG: MarR family transcriptional regulator [Bacteroidales bacterium]|nr:MarR family transcriptional regulator [Bacteroidales bacterium]MBO7648395.1 MarR family transcriptional regulator [Bacteroidales bacterium]